MLFHPGIMALILGSFLISFMVLYSSWFAIKILRSWDLRSGSELQLDLERRTYLISTLLACVFGFQLLSLFLYIFTGDRLHSLFVGAMCAAGVFFVNGFGYPVLLLKVINFLLAGLWLILNISDNRGYDYPLIKPKYTLLLLIAPLVLLETILQLNFFLPLRPDIITSCCGSLFKSNGTELLTQLYAFPHIPMKIAFYLSIALTIGLGLFYLKKGRGGTLFAVMAGVDLVIAILSIFSFISLYFYELPTHHCPFCLLQGEYGYVGYPIYFSILGSAISGMGVGLLMPFRKIESLSRILPIIQKKLVLVCLVLLLLLAFIVTYRMVVTDFILE